MIPIFHIWNFHIWKMNNVKFSIHIWNYKFHIWIEDFIYELKISYVIWFHIWKFHMWNCHFTYLNLNFIYENCHFTYENFHFIYENVHFIYEIGHFIYEILCEIFVMDKKAGNALFRDHISIFVRGKMLPDHPTHVSSQKWVITFD